MAELELDFGATMEKAFDAAEAREDAPAPEPPAPAAKPAAELADTLEAPEESSDATKDSDQSPEPEGEPGEAQPLAAPARWSAAEKERFNALPREAQEIVLSRESDVNKLLTQRTQEIAEQKQRFQALEETLAPRRQAFAVDGLDDVGAVRQLFALSDFAAQDPAGFVKWFAQARGIDLGGLNESSESAQHADPEIHKLSQTVQELQRQLSQAQAAQQQTVQQQHVATIEQFSTEADEAGQPAHPHFEAVRGHMAALLRSGAAGTLKHAYDMAVWANADTRKLLMEERAQAEEHKRIAEAKAAAKAAKRGSQSAPRSTGGVNAKPVKRTIEETMAEAYDRVQGLSD